MKTLLKLNNRQHKHTAPGKPRQHLSTGTTVPFVDNRPEALRQQEIQRLADRSLLERQPDGLSFTRSSLSNSAVQDEETIQRQVLTKFIFDVIEPEEESSEENAEEEDEEAFEENAVEMTDLNEEPEEMDLSKGEGINESSDAPQSYIRINDVVIGGRTESPFTGTMGAHSTAWVAHIDRVRRVLVNRTLDDALENFMEVIAEELESPLRQFSKMLETKHLLRLLDAEKRLMLTRQIIRGLRKNGSPQQTILQWLKILVNDYLTYVNFLPLSTVAGGDPSGHGEGVSRGQINLFEYFSARLAEHESGNNPELLTDIQEERKELSSKNFEGALKNMVTARIKKNVNEKQLNNLRAVVLDNLWTLFAIETLDIFARKDPPKRLTVWIEGINNFLRTIRNAYPYSFNFAGLSQPKNQIAGIKLALKNANISLNSSFGEALTKAIREGSEQEQAQTRDSYDEVARSDLIQGGSGFQATVLLDEEGLIGDIQMQGRTPSPFSGTMGAHSTAWAAHLDAVRNKLIHLTLPQAINLLALESGKLMKDRSLTLAGLVSEKQQYSLIWSYNYLQEQLSTSTDEMQLEEQASFLEGLIADYLTFLNFLPLSTVETGSVPGGRSEGRHRQFLLNYEENGPSIFNSEQQKNPQGTLKHHLLGLYDPGAQNAFPPQIDWREETDFNELLNLSDPSEEGYYDESHDLFTYIGDGMETENPKPPKGLNNLKKTIAQERFLHTISEAYPRAAKDSGLVKLNLPTVKSKSGSQKTKFNPVEEYQLNFLLNMNNCLINAIYRATFGDNAQVSREQLIQIRTRIGSIGTMLFATPQVIAIILDVLGIHNRGVVVVYQDRPSEDFGNTNVNPIMVEHTGHLHFEPYRPEDVGFGGTSEKEPMNISEEN